VKEDYPPTLMELEQRFGDDGACRQYLFGASVAAGIRVFGLRRQGRLEWKP
jgi:hypothetical protein